MAQPQSALRELRVMRDQIAEVCPSRIILDCEIFNENLDLLQALNITINYLNSFGQSYRSATPVGGLQFTEIVVLTDDSPDCTTLGCDGFSTIDDHLNSLVEKIGGPVHIARLRVVSVQTDKIRAIGEICAAEGTIVPERTFVCLNRSDEAKGRQSLNPRLTFISAQELFRDMDDMLQINLRLIESVRSVA